MTPMLVPHNARRTRQLPPLRRSESVASATAAAAFPGEDNGAGIIQTLCRLTVSQWIVLLYPLFLFAIHRKRDEGDVTVVDSSAVIQIGLTAVCGMWMLNRFLDAMRGFERVLIKTPLRWMLMYAVLAVMSIAWSDSPSLTAFRSAQVGVFLLVVVDAIASMRTAQEMVRFQLLYAAMVSLFWQLPGLANGISLGALHASDVPGTIVAAMFAGFLVRGREWRILHAAIVTMVLLSTSAGCFLACTGGLIVVLLLMRGRAAGIGMMLVCGSFLLVALLPQYANTVFFFGKNEGQIASGTGRLPIWQWVLEERVAARPIFGFGFGEGEVQARLYNVGGFRMMHMHNAFMSAIVNLGIAGVAVWALMWCAMARAAWKIPQHRARLAMMGGAVALFLNTMSMESVTAPLSMPWIAHAMFFVLLAVGQWEVAERYVVPRLRPPHRPIRSEPVAVAVS
jgi:O-antigen ligase